jgi:acyl-phosphate glycerol 3-phosphate acyltransferase
MSALLVGVSAYLLGSVSFGILYSRLRGRDVREVDAPGGSGIYRQYGLWPALTVTLLDILKGTLAALLARVVDPQFVWLAVGAVVLGHNYPVFFRFDGGGGIAPLLGGLALAAPVALLALLGTAALFMPLYKAALQRTVKLNVIPATAVVAVPVGLVVAALYGGLAAMLAGALAMAVRAVHLLRPARRPEGDVTP